MPARSVNYHRLALKDLRATTLWYVRRSRSAAAGFVQEVRRAASKIEASAESYPVEYRDVRWLKLKKYPYIVRFLILDANRCQVIAVSHTSRRPLHWIRRLSRP
jgi:plasmid stabilization system protein ParE